MRYILASGSPRRKELLGLLLPEFTVSPSRYDESSLNKNGRTPEEVVKILSCEKAREVFGRLSGAEEICVIGGDTIVLSPDGELLGKPSSEEDAARMLRLLSGRKHTVLTAVTVLAEKSGVRIEKIFSVSTEVVFYPLTESDIRWYLSTGEPFDKAGSYGIQGKGGLFVREIHGDYNNVVGLPVAALAREMHHMGLV